MSTSRGPRISIFSSSIPLPPTSSNMLSWLPWNGQYSALPSSSSGDRYARPAGKRKMMYMLGGGLAAIVLIGMIGSSSTVRSNWAETPSIVNPSTAESATEDPYWGMTESQGWQPFGIELADLGEIAEQRFRLGFTPDEEGTEKYFQQIYDFVSKLSEEVSKPMLYSLYKHLPPLQPIFPAPPKVELGPPAMVNYKLIHQTDKNRVMNNDMKEWVKMNEPDGWELNFMDDADAWEWVKEVFGGSDIEWAWKYMHRGVLRADFLRYLLPLIEGGVYSDVDTRPLRRVEDWGKINVETLDLSETDGVDWKSKQSTYPAVIVSIDVNVHKKLDWWRGWPRALDICQWTLSSSPNHPIFMDAARRVVNSTRVVEQWDKDRASEIERLQNERPDGWESKVSDLKGQKKDHALNVMEWTGPGLFSDSVLAFLLARYKVSWHRLRGLSHPLRIGDVLILPITGFSPGGEKDFAAEGWDSPQASVLHNFRGSWKGDGAR